MPEPNIIFLIGMPAAGKSYWGYRIAEAHGLQFVDLDVYIAAQEQASIAALFVQYGEKGFREREQKYLKQLIDTAGADVVIASGGGTPCSGDNLQLMKAHGTVIYLQADIDHLLSNLAESTETRPMLKGRVDVRVYLEELLSKRSNYYEQANHILHAKNISLTTFAEIITTCISRH